MDLEGGEIAWTEEMLSKFEGLNQKIKTDDDWRNYNYLDVLGREQEVDRKDERMGDNLLLTNFEADMFSDEKEEDSQGATGDFQRLHISRGRHPKSTDSQGAAWDFQELIHDEEDAHLNPQSAACC